MVIPNGNGSKLSLWAIGILAPPVLGIAVGWVATNNTRLTNHTERLAVTESQVKDIRDELQRINQKLDRLLERNHNGGR